jgi:hypothetical protein
MQNLIKSFCNWVFNSTKNTYTWAAHNLRLFWLHWMLAAGGSMAIVLTEQGHDLLLDLEGRLWACTSFALWLLVWTCSLWVTARWLVEIDDDKSYNDISFPYFMPRVLGGLPYLFIGGLIILKYGYIENDYVLGSVVVTWFVFIGITLLRRLYIDTFRLGFYNNTKPTVFIIGLWQPLNKLIIWLDTAPEFILLKTLKSVKNIGIRIEKLLLRIERMKKYAENRTEHEAYEYQKQAKNKAKVKAQKYLYLLSGIFTLLFTIISLVFSVAAWQPFLIPIAQWFQPISILLIFFSFYVLLLSWAIAIQVRYKIPVFILGIIWVAIVSNCNNNHALNTMGSDTKDNIRNRPTLDVHYTKWLAQHDSTTIDTINIIAVEGGGSRAMNWTNGVLEKLYRNNPSFWHNTYAITGASGGMVGATLWETARVFEPKIEDSKLTEIREGNYLSAVTAYFLGADLLQRFIPCSRTGTDRTRALENTFGQHFTNKNVLDGAFLSIWRTDSTAPALFINGTIAETGGRAICSNIRLDNQNFAGCIDILDELNRDIPIKTATTVPCRFPYVTSGGKLGATQLGTVIDGGYYDNTGLTTAIDIIRGITAINGSNKNIKIRLIAIKNSDMDDIFKPDSNRLVSKNYSDFLIDLKTPFIGIRNVSNEIVRHAAQEVLRLKRDGTIQSIKLYELDRGHAVKYPLSWYLSDTAKASMQKQINNSLKDGQNIK